MEEVGRLFHIEKSGQGLRLLIHAPLIAGDVAIGDSVAVNGVCLTVTQKKGEDFAADVVPETVRKSTFSTQRAGALVNLERAMSASARFGGHIVAGHVDGLGRIVQLVSEDNAKVLTVRAEPELLRYIVPKGSIAIDGISLTVMDRDQQHFRVSVIPHSATVTTLQMAKVGALVNLEVDAIGKYAETLLADAKESNQSGLTFDKLKNWGY